MRRSRLTGLLLLLPLSLGACSSFLFDDEELEPQRIQVQSQRAADPEFPNLAKVPDEAPRPSASAQRQELLESLSADRQNARYSDQPLTPQAAAADGGEGAGPAYPPPPSLGTAPPPPDLGETAAADEPTMPPPPVDEPAPRAASEDAPTPPATAQSDEPKALSSTTPPAAPPVPSETTESSAPILPPEARNGGLTLPTATTSLLQERAFQQEAKAHQRLQQMAAERRAFEQQARQRAIEQQWQREQMIQQQRAQWRYPTSRQQASLPPAAAVGPAAAPAPTPQSLPAFAGGPGQLVGLIYFRHGSAGLDARDRRVLRQVAALQQTQGRALRVIGHASSRTGVVDLAKHQSANREMSMRRAQAVADALVGMGAPRDRITVEGRGDQQPVYHEFTVTGEAGNRRVEIYLE